MNNTGSSKQIRFPIGLIPANRRCELFRVGFPLDQVGYNITGCDGVLVRLLAGALAGNQTALQQIQRRSFTDVAELIHLLLSDRIGVFGQDVGILFRTHSIHRLSFIRQRQVNLNLCAFCIVVLSEFSPTCKKTR